MNTNGDLENNILEKKVNIKKEQKMCYYHLLEALDASQNSDESSQTLSSEEEDSSENENSNQSIPERDENFEESCKKSSMKEVQKIFGFNI